MERRRSLETSSARKHIDTDILDDMSIRPVLRSRLQSRLERKSDAVLIEELGFCAGRVRIDLIVIDVELHGYEIKSDRDTLRRLEKQIELYGKILDKATIVVGSKYIEQVFRILPDWWEILQVSHSSSGPFLKVVRRGRKNPGRDPRALVQLLWRDDAIELLEQKSMDRGVRSKPRELIWDKVCEHFDIDEIAASVRRHLKERTKPQDQPQPL